MKRLRKESVISYDSLVTLMSGSAAAKLHDETFLGSPEKRKEECGISVDSLAKFMSGSVAARLGDETF